MSQANGVMRDPSTGKFVSTDGTDMDIEVVTFNASAGISAADIESTGSEFPGTVVQFQGNKVIDYDEIVDRNERLVLLGASHRLKLFPQPTETDAGLVSCTAEVSADPALTGPSNDLTSGTDNLETINGPQVVGQARQDDTIDIIGRPMSVAHSLGYEDEANGAGGPGTPTTDTVELPRGLPGEAAEFHPRDELFVNGTFTLYNFDAANVHSMVHGQHVYGAFED